MRIARTSNEQRSPYGHHAVRDHLDRGCRRHARRRRHAFDRYLRHLERDRRLGERLPARDPNRSRRTERHPGASLPRPDAFTRRLPGGLHGLDYLPALLRGGYGDTEPAVHHVRVGRAFHGAGGNRHGRLRPLEGVHGGAARERQDPLRACA